MSLTRDFEQTVVELAAAIFGALKDALQVRFDVRVVEAA